MQTPIVSQPRLQQLANWIVRPYAFLDGYQLRPGKRLRIRASAAAV